MQNSILSIPSDPNSRVTSSRLKPLDSSEIRLLSAIGFWAAKSGYLVPAVRIFEALIILRPGAEFPYIGLAMAYMAVGMHDDASHTLNQRAQQAGIESAPLMIWRALGDYLSGDISKAKQHLNQCSESGGRLSEANLRERLSQLIGLIPTRPTWPTPCPVSDSQLDG